jgi:hypothetical protein
MRVCMLVALLMSLTGCFAPAVDWHGDPAFTPEERANIEAGARFTSEHAHQPMPLIVWDWDGSRNVRYIRRAMPDGEAVRAWAIGGAMTIGPGYASVATAAHEWGHISGMGHVDHGLMQSHSNPLEWSDSDEAECARHCH